MVCGLHNDVHVLLYVLATVLISVFSFLCSVVLIQTG
jgi:hypothetical protein